LVALWQASIRSMAESKPGRWCESLVIRGPGSHLFAAAARLVAWTSYRGRHREAA
jgi:hypothetical protein